MTRIEEAKSLRNQGLSFTEIAKKMGIKEQSVICYVYSDTVCGVNKHRKRVYGEKVRQTIKNKLNRFNLPLEWEDELMKMFAFYHYSRKSQGGLGCVIDVQSLIQLLCRHYKIPTPRSLEVATYQGSGSKRQVSGYMDVLKYMDGVEVAKPIDYVKYFVKKENLPENVIDLAKTLIEKIPKMHRQSKNPRTLAGAVIYEIYKPKKWRDQTNRIITQRCVADCLEITEVSLRNSWRQFFKDET